MPIEGEPEGDYYTRGFRERARLFHEYVELEKAAYIASPTFSNSGRKLRLMQRRILTQQKKFEQRARLFADAEITSIYRQGLIHASGNPDIKLNARDRSAILDIVQRGVVGPDGKKVPSLYHTFNEAFRYLRQDLNARAGVGWVVNVKELEARSKSQAGYDRLLQRRLNLIRRDHISPRLDAKQYEGFVPGELVKFGTSKRERSFFAGQFTAIRGGQKDVAGTETFKTGNIVVKNRRWKIEGYFNMVARASAQRAFNTATLNHARRQKIVAVRCHDGPACGLTSHDDHYKVNGKILSLSEAETYPLAHPNCQRTFSPMPGEPEPPRVDERPSMRKGSLSDARRIFENNAILEGKALGQIAQQAVVSSAKSLVADLVSDAELRSRVFHTIIQTTPVLRRFDERVTQLVARLAQKTGLGPSHERVAQNVVDWVDHWLENPQSQAVPGYVRRILMGRPDANLRRTVNGYEHLDNFVTYQEMMHRATLSHQHLNVINSIENSYGSEWLKVIANDLPGGLGRLQDVVNATNQRFAPGDTIFNRTFRSATGKIPGAVYNRALKRPVDRLAAKGVSHIPIVRNGRVTLVRTSHKELRADRLGLRYAYDKRFLRVQTTAVNRYNFLSTQQARFVAWTKGMPITKVVQTSDAAGAIRETIKYRSKKDLVEQLAYNSGMLTRITLRPSDLVHLGFRWDPATGWRKPLPQLTVRTPAAAGLRLRSTTRLNKGITVGRGRGQVRAENLIFSGRAPVRTGALGMQRRMPPNVRNMLPDGVRVRTVTQELVLSLGDTVSLGSIGKLKLPRIEDIGLRGATFVGRMDSMKDVKQYMAVHGVKGFVEDMTFISLIGEMRALGWSWLRIGKTFHVNPSTAAEMAYKFNQLWPSFKYQANRATLAARMEEVIGSRDKLRRASRKAANAARTTQTVRGAEVALNAKNRLKMANYIAKYEEEFEKTGIRNINKERTIRAYLKLLEGR